jgi:hypothetical protein
MRAGLLARVPWRKALNTNIMPKSTRRRRTGSMSWKVQITGAMRSKQGLMGIGFICYVSLHCVCASMPIHALFLPLAAILWSDQNSSSQVACIWGTRRM